MQNMQNWNVLFFFITIDFSTNTNKYSEIKIFFIRNPSLLNAHLVSSVPLKHAFTISLNATAKGIVSLIPMVSGEGPLDEPTGIDVVLKSLVRLPTLSVLVIEYGRGDIRPRVDA